MDMRITIDGATPEELAGGLAAAQAAFDKAGITAERAAEAVFDVEGWDITGFPYDDAHYPDDEDFEFLGVWDEADQAAAAAACRDWPDNRDQKPLGWNFSMRSPTRAGPNFWRRAKHTGAA